MGGVNQISYRQVAQVLSLCVKTPSKMIGEYSSLPKRAVKWMRASSGSKATQPPDGAGVGPPNNFAGCQPAAFFPYPLFPVLRT